VRQVVVDPRDQLERKAYWVIQVHRAQLDPEVKLDPRAQLDRKVLSDRKALLDLKVRKDFRVRMGLLAIWDPLVIQERKVNKVYLEIQDLRV